MQDSMILLLKFSVLTVVAIVFSLLLTDTIFRTIKAYGEESDKQKKRAVQCLLFSVLYYLSIYVYIVYWLLFH